MRDLKSKQYGPTYFLFLFMVSCLFLFCVAFGADQLCRNDISKRLPFYPNSELISKEKDLVRYRAAGTSSMIFHSSDDVATVAEWYRKLNLEQLDKGILRGLAEIRRTYEANPEGGTTINYKTACGI